MDGSKSTHSDSVSPAWEATLCLLLALTLGYSWMFAGSDSPNERSRVYLAVSLVDAGTVSIQEAIDRYGGVFDMARVDGEPRCDKAPGASLLAAVVYGAARLVTEAESWSLNELMHLMRFWLMIPVGLFGFLMLRVALRHLGLDPPMVDVASVGYILGTSAFHYSHAYFGHQIAGSALIGSIACLLAAEARLESRHSERDWLSPTGWSCLFSGAAGALAGVAGMTEYPAAIPCVFIALFALSSPIRRDGWGLLAFIAGALPFAGILFGYHTLAFGGPLELPYFHLVQEQFEKVHESGMGGLESPTWDWFWGGMLSLHRGWISTSPFFLLMVPGFLSLWRAGRRRLVVLTGVVVTYYVMFISSWPLWEGGWGYGPRHLVAMMGVAAIPAAAGMGAVSGSWLRDGVVRGLVVFSISCHQLIGAFWPEPTPGAKNPVLDFTALMWSENIVAPNLVARFTDLSGVLTLVPLGVLVVGWIGLVVVRGLKTELTNCESWRRALAVPGLSLCIATAGMWGLVRAGHSWNAEQQEDMAGLAEFFQKEQVKAREADRP